jgi:hypothetical protein
MRTLMAQDDEILKALREKLKEAETGMLKLGYRYISGAYRKMTKRTIMKQPPEIRRAPRRSSPSPSRADNQDPATSDRNGRERGLGGEGGAMTSPESVFYTDEKSKSQVQNWSAHGLEPRGDRGNSGVTTDPTFACLSCLHPARGGQSPAHMQPSNNQGEIVFYTEEESKSQVQNWSAHGLEPRGDRGKWGWLGIASPFPRRATGSSTVNTTREKSRAVII